MATTRSAAVALSIPLRQLRAPRLLPNLAEALRVVKSHTIYPYCHESHDMPRCSNG